MPTQRFLNLEEEKRRRILEAAIKEFSSYDYDKVSINRIIQESDISRGAFYTYFLDKDDLLVHLFEAEEDKAVGYFMEILERNRGDFFKSIQEWVIEIIKIRKEKIVQDSFVMFYRSGFLKNLSLASMRSHMDQGRRDNIDVVLEAIPKDYFPKTLSEEEKGIGIQTAFSLASLSLLQAFSIEKRKEGIQEKEVCLEKGRESKKNSLEHKEIGGRKDFLESEETVEREAFIEQILYVFQKQIQLLEKALGGIE